MNFATLATSKRAQAVLALVIVLVGMRVWEHSDDGKLTVIETAKEEIADNYSTDVTALQFNKAGELQYNLHAEGATHYLTTDTALVQRPALVSYGEDGTVWRSAADHGKVLPGGDIVDLWDNVIIRRLDDATTIATTHVTFNTLKGEADTTAAVTITTPTSRLHGKGMHANINTEVVNLLNDVRGTYGSRTPR